jgi:hypothetical protein
MARFKIKRSRNPEVTSPWAIKDTNWPVFVRSYVSFEAAIRAMNNIARAEKGFPPLLELTTDEIRNAMEAKQ